MCSSFIRTPLLVSVLSPTRGPIAGNTIVTIGGSNFVSSVNLVCRFGILTPVAATWNSATQLLCRSPATSAGPVAVEVSNNNQDFTSNAVSYLYDDNAAVTDLTPTSGPATGGSAVTVNGANFVNTANLMCRFGAVIMPATYTTATRLVCQSPAGAIGSVSVEVTNNNQDYTSNSIAFLYQSVATVLTVLPVSGPVTGATNVTVVGSNFVGTTPYCRFGTTAGVVAQRVSASLLFCQSPATAAGSVAVEVTNNNQGYTSNAVQFLFVAAASVVSISPTSGPAAGNSPVTVVGTNFVSSSHLVCRFGSLSPVAASWLTVTTLACTAPTAAAGSVALEVSNNNQDFTGNAVSICPSSRPT